MIPEPHHNAFFYGARLEMLGHILTGKSPVETQLFGLSCDILDIVLAGEPSSETSTTTTVIETCVSFLRAVHHDFRQLKHVDDFARGFNSLRTTAPAAANKLSQILLEATDVAAAHHRPRANRQIVNRLTAGWLALAVKGNEFDPTVGAPLLSEVTRRFDRAARQSWLAWSLQHTTVKYLVASTVVAAAVVMAIPLFHSSTKESKITSRPDLAFFENTDGQIPKPGDLLGGPPDEVTIRKGDRFSESLVEQLLTESGELDSGLFRLTPDRVIKVAWRHRGKITYSDDVWLTPNLFWNAGYETFVLLRMARGADISELQLEQLSPVLARLADTSDELTVRELLESALRPQIGKTIERIEFRHMRHEDTRLWPKKERQ